ncbi:hypothetical protein HYQ46_005810 [Verticillium longisporum]|nr:hypothetical protein HYQ46_005810 [Verticillium longisporum]
MRDATYSTDDGELDVPNRGRGWILIHNNEQARVAACPLVQDGPHQHQCNHDTVPICSPGTPTLSPICDLQESSHAWTYSTNTKLRETFLRRPHATLASTLKPPVATKIDTS